MICLMYGIGMEKDHDKANEISLRLSEKGNEIAIAEKLFNGWGCRENDKKNFEICQNYFEKNKEKKEMDDLKKIEMGYCCYMLGFFHQYKRNFVLKDLMKSKQFFEKGVEMGSCLCMNELAMIYEEGRKGVEKDVEKAKYYWNIVKELDPNNEKQKNFFKSLNGGK